MKVSLTIEIHKLLVKFKSSILSFSRLCRSQIQVTTGGELLPAIQLPNPLGHKP